MHTDLRFFVIISINVCFHILMFYVLERAEENALSRSR
uniref:Uncharacterized protein n=1 Tax=Rhizophora mucronata TaxID=61149 RepID=A0A2P2P1X8_RHIMU